MGTEQRSSTLNVCLRIKPPKHEAEQSTYVVDSERSLRVKTWRGNEIYKFSHIFKEDSSQEGVFQVTAEPAITSFLEGEDCLLFAYGTTNAGKTFTVQGTSKNPGIVPRAITNIFASLKDKIDKHPRIAPFNYSNAQLRAQTDKIKVEKMKNVILASGNPSVQNTALKPLLPHVNCSLSFSSAFSSTISADFDAGAEMEHSDANTSIVEELGWNKASRCSLWISMVEVYNENIIDLLGPEKTHTKVSVSTDLDGRFYLQGQNEINVSSIEEATAVIQYGNKQRKNSSTLLNIASSRSHCILRVRLLRADRVIPDMMQVGPQSPAAVDIEDFRVSTFMFCDLAGAERVNKAGNKGERAKETCNINNSLVVLGRCLETLRLKGGTMQHARNAIVPYRDSKLTMILQPLLSEPGPKSLLVNISTSSNLLDETLNVLKFSSVARVVVVKENRKPLSQNQMPTHAKQLMDLKAAMELENSVATSGRSSEEPEEGMSVEEGTAEVEIQTSFAQMCDDVEERATQTNIVTNLTDSQEVAELKAQVLMYEQRVEELAQENQATVHTVRSELFANFEKLEAEMLKCHKEQLDSKESQLYNLMSERLSIQEDYYKQLLAEAQTNAKSIAVEVQLRKERADEEINQAEQDAIENFKKLQSQNECLEQQTKEFLEKIKEKEKEFNELLYAYGEKDKEVDEMKQELKRANAVTDNALASELTAAQKIESLKLELEVRNDMLNTTSQSCLDLEKQLKISTQEKCEKFEKMQGQESEMLVLKEALSENAEMLDKLKTETEKLKQDKIAMVSQMTSLEKQIQDLNEENGDLKKDRNAIKEQLKNALAENMQSKEDNEKKLKSEQKEWYKKLKVAEEKCARYKQCIEYLMDQYRPDYRRSMAGCANEEASWAALEKEVQAIPSRCAELEKENHELKKQLNVKEEDYEKLKDRRDAMFAHYDRELQAKSQELEICKRETQALNKQLLGMTPRKQDNTPQKQSEFKTPLRASVNHRLPNSASSANKASSKPGSSVVTLDSDDSDDTDFVVNSRLTRSTSSKKLTITRLGGRTTNSMHAKVDSPAVQDDGELVGKSSCRRNAKAKPSPAKENMEPPALPVPKSDKPKSKTRSRRKLCASSLHPALDDDEAPVDVELPTANSLQMTRRRLRSTFK